MQTLNNGDPDDPDQHLEIGGDTGATQKPPEVPDEPDQHLEIGEDTVATQQPPEDPTANTQGLEVNKVPWLGTA